jgi:hypothetical protein
LLLAICVGAAGFIAWAIVGLRASRATSPCPPFTTVTLTGTLVEVWHDDGIVSSEQAILDGMPRHVCAVSSAAGPDGGGVTVSDCDFPEYTLRATLVP